MWGGESLITCMISLVKSKSPLTRPTIHLEAINVPFCQPDWRTKPSAIPREDVYFFTFLFNFHLASFPILFLRIIGFL